ncbi:MAG TPA: type II toxin-antitoxin system VapC family toxin [Steroidobacteraceae bacterium]
MRFVLDASVTLSWLLRDTAARDEGYPLAVLNALRDPSTAATVPMTWGLEIANVIARSEAKDLVTAAQSGSFIALLEGIPIEVDSETFTQVLGDTLQLSRRYKLSSYDASYLELALRNGAPIATLDDDLRRAATKAGVKLFKPA